MSAPTITSEPAEIRAGDTVNWLIATPDYQASAGWSLEYTLINAAGKITFISAAEGDAHRVTVAAAITVAWATGSYAWQRRAKKSAEAYTLATGTVEIKPDFAGLVSSDARTHAQNTLAALEAWIEGHDLSVAEYEIAGRRMKYIPVADLLKLRSQYQREVRGKSGKSGRIYLRF